MTLIVDAIWAVWSIGASIYDYFQTSAIEERIHALESVLTIHQCVIGVLSAGLIILITYMFFRKHWLPQESWQWHKVASPLFEIMTYASRMQKCGGSSLKTGTAPWFISQYLPFGNMIMFQSSSFTVFNKKTPVAQCINIDSWKT